MNFVYFGYCNFRKNMLYYSHSKGGHANGKVKLTTLTTPERQEHKGIMERNGAFGKVIQAMQANV